MALSSGTHLGPYEILAPLGAGGMGEVYRARDGRLGRDVALKVLPEVFAKDAERMARFQREAELLASLNHPNIATLYGLEESGGVRALAMELVEGPTLADRISAGPLPLDEALPLAKQIAEALEAAHEKAIIHRDLKPANVKVRPDGVVKLLDFGLAKALDDAPAATSSSNSPTISLAATRVGVILGTAAYMSPEQAKGRPVDRRADIWAFGVVLYEMLSGRRLFGGETAPESLAAVLTKEPVLDAIPEPARAVIARCLRKDPKTRFRDIGDVRLALEEGPAEAPVSAPPARPWPWMAATALLALAVPAAWFLKPKPDPPLVELEISAPDGATLGPLAWAQHGLSPDGRRLVFLAARKDGKRLLWLRPLDSPAAVPLPGTEGAVWPFWSPDSRWVGFTANGNLQKIDVAGGRPQVICDAAGRGGTWNSQGVILFAETGKPIQRVSASGGAPTPVFGLDATRQEAFHTDPQFLPDGNRFLYMSVGKEMGPALGSLDGKIRRFLFRNTESPAFYAPHPAGGGSLLYILRNRLLARPFDLAKGEFTGEAVPIIDSIYGGPSWSHSGNGILAFRRGHALPSQLTWLSREGKPLETMGEAGFLCCPRLSPDQKTIAFTRAEGNFGIWLFDVTRRTPTRFTLESGSTYYPLWSPDGKRILYSSFRRTGGGVFERSATGLGQETIVKRSIGDGELTATDLSRDGRWVVLSENAAGDRRLLLLSGADGKLIPVVEANRGNGNGSLSPDGRWILYATGTADRTDVFAQSLPEEAGGSRDAAGKWQISTAGGAQPAWRADGKEIFYVAPDGRMMAAPVESGAAFFRPGTPQPLFQTRFSGGFTRDYDVSPDGRRFLLTQPVAGAEEPPITVILNWPKLLEKK